MNHRLPALGLLIACLSGASAEAPRPPRQHPEAWAEKMFGPSKNLVHDFGPVPRGAMLHWDFVMTNIYAVPIEISNVRASGCITAMSNKGRLQPNEKATISVRMDATRFIGRKVVAIWVTVGPTHGSQARLMVTADCRADIRCEPGEVEFGSVAPGQTPTAFIDLEYAGPLAWRVREAVVPKGAPFEATVKERYRRRGEVGYRVEVSLRKAAVPGKFRTTFFLRTNDPSAALLPVVVRGSIHSPLVAVPSALDLKEVNCGETLTRAVRIRCRDPFTIVHLNGPDEVKFGEPPLPNREQTVTLRIEPPAQAGPFRYEVKVWTDLRDDPVVVVIDGVAGKK